MNDLVKLLCGPAFRCVKLSSLSDHSYKHRDLLGREADILDFGHVLLHVFRGYRIPFTKGQGYGKPATLELMTQVV